MSPEERVNLLAALSCEHGKACQLQCKVCLSEAFGMVEYQAANNVVLGVRKIADELWEEAERPTKKSARSVSEVLKALSTNLHRFCQIQMGQEPLPAPGSRISGALE